MTSPQWGSPAAIYELDKQGSALCRDMSIAGFAFDFERAKAFEALLRGEEGGARVRLSEAVGRRVKALSIRDLQHAFFRELEAPVFFRSELTGAPSLGAQALQAYIACADPRLRIAALSVLAVRRARKVLSTYVRKPLEDMTGDGRIHPTWKNCGPVSGRWACSDPNIQNLPRPINDPTFALGGIRSLYRAAPGHMLVSYDKSQLELRVAAYASGDRAMIAACESRDMHAANAIIVFGAAFDAAAYAAAKAAHEEPPGYVLWDGLRTLAKSAAFAVCYMATADTVYSRILADGKGHLLPKGLASVEAMLSRLRRGFADYFAWQERRLLQAIKHGYTDEPVTGRRRWLGHDPSPTECANHPIQGGAAGIMNLELPRIVARLPRGARCVAQVHDAAYFEVPEGKVDEVVAVVKEESEREILLHSSGLRARFPSDIKVSERMAA